MDEITHFSQYANDTKNVCIYTSISLLFIFIFIISPLNQFAFSSTIGKLIIFIILCFTLYKNIYTTHLFSKNTNTSLLSGDWSNMKSNIICSYIFSLFILWLLIIIIKEII